VLGLHSADVVAAAVRRLPDVERTAVALAFVADHSYRDVARLMQLPEGTTKSLIRRALRRLNEQLALRAGK
jgi:RNA polymerase sigma-70 factor (ECF subfamily)